MPDKGTGQENVSLAAGYLTAPVCERFDIPLLWDQFSGDRHSVGELHKAELLV